MVPQAFGYSNKATNAWAVEKEVQTEPWRCLAMNREGSLENIGSYQPDPERKNCLSMSPGDAEAGRVHNSDLEMIRKQTFSVATTATCSPQQRKKTVTDDA